MKKLLSPTSNFILGIFLFFLFSLNASAQELPKTEIKKEATDVQVSAPSPMQTVKTESSTNDGKKEKKKRKRCRDKKGSAHQNPSNDDAKLDSIKAVKNKEKGIK